MINYRSMITKLINNADNVITTKAIREGTMTDETTDTREPLTHQQKHRVAAASADLLGMEVSLDTDATQRLFLWEKENGSRRLEPAEKQVLIMATDMAINSMIREVDQEATAAVQAAVARDADVPH